MSEKDLYELTEATKMEEFYGEYEWTELDEEILRKDIYYYEKD